MKKRLLINISISLVTVVLFLLITEGVVRFFTSQWFNKNFHESSLVITFGNCRTTDFGSAKSRSFYKINESSLPIIYDYKAGARGELYGSGVRINSHGMRDDEVSVTKPDSTYRIAVLGDSIAFGYGVEQEEVFPNILEEKLNKEGLGRYEVLNFGVVGYSMLQELALLEDRVLKFNPDLIIVAQHLNDIYGSGSVAIAPAPLRKFLAENSKLLGCFKINHMLPVRSISEEKTFSGPYQEVYARDSVSWSYLDFLLMKFGEISKTKNIPIVLALTPIFESLNDGYKYKDAHEALADAGRKAGLYVINMSPSPKLRYDDEASAYQVTLGDIDHPNRKGHAKLAEIIYNGLLEQDLLQINESNK